jgi:hypothetical protein
VAQGCAEWLQWPTVAAREAALVREVITQDRTFPVRPGHATAQVPALDLTHLDRLTDEIGIIQFAIGPEPALDSGYCVDDVARLAIVAADLLTIGADGEQNALATRWLTQSMRFLVAAVSPGTGGAMHNVLSYHGTWQDEPHLGDHVGRAIWTLGVLASSPALPRDLVRAAAKLLDKLAPHVEAIADLGLRSGGYAMIGFAKAGRGDQVRPLLDRLDAALCDDPAWRWFEPELTYDNARLGQAMLLGAELLGDREAAKRAVGALDWYVEHVGLADGTLRCVGNKWHHRGESPQAWLGDDGDEQPLDAAAMTEALVDLWHHTADPAYARMAGWAFAWFLGRNRAGVRLYVDETGACRDGLSPSGANMNEGAESTLAYYQALLCLLRAGLAALPHASAKDRDHGPSRDVGRNAVRSVPATPPSNRMTKGRRSRTTEGTTDAR